MSTVSAPPPADRKATAAPLSVEALLRQQQTLTPVMPATDEETVNDIPAASEAASETAVETFSRHHESSGTERPLQERWYRSLLPAEPPGPGEQYAFEVDLDACSGCKACVVACHSLNGLADDEAWRDVGLLQTPPAHTPATSIDSLIELPVIQHVTTACHHCIDPGCLRGCPVDAYEKDPATGIVRHLDDQCFGCQYCTLMCPYEVPKYHAGHGIVRKCDMCSGRLAAGEAPACVQACPHEAIRIRTVSQAGVKAAVARAAVCGTSDTFALPDTPPVDQTVPTTIYRTERLDLSKLEPADLRTPRPSHAHGPLTIMLALTQIGVGGLVAAAAMWLLGTPATALPIRIAALVGFAILNAGLAAATLHLGRPHLAFRAVIGWRHSWLSREAIAFGLFMPVAAAAVAVAFSDAIAEFVGDWFLGIQSLAGPIFLSAAVAGLAAVFTSVMIYVAARKPLWTLPTTTLRFLLTTLLGAGALASVSRIAADDNAWLAVAATLLAVAAKLALDFRATVLRSAEAIAIDDHSARLLRGPLRRVVTARLALSAAGAVLLPIAAITGSVGLAAVAATLLVAGELVERWLFFTAVAGPKMPGGLPS